MDERELASTWVFAEDTLGTGAPTSSFLMMLGTEIVTALPVMRKPEGLLLGLPGGSLPDSEVNLGWSDPAYPLGPSGEVRVPTCTRSGARSRSLTVGVTLADAQWRLLTHVVDDGENIVTFLDEQGREAMPHPASLVTAARAWVADRLATGGADRLGGFYTGDEGAGAPSGGLAFDGRVGETLPFAAEHAVPEPPASVDDEEEPFPGVVPGGGAARPAPPFSARARVLTPLGQAAAGGPAFGVDWASVTGYAPPSALRPPGPGYSSRPAPFAQPGLGRARPLRPFFAPQPQAGSPGFLYGEGPMPGAGGPPPGGQVTPRGFTGLYGAAPVGPGLFGPRAPAYVPVQLPLRPTQPCGAQPPPQYHDYSSMPPLETLVAQQCMILQNLYGRVQGQHGDLSLLDGAGSSGGGAGAGARGAAALEVQRRELEETPGLVVQAIRTRLARALGSDPGAPQDAQEYLRRHAAFARHHDLGYAMTLIAEAWNAMEMLSPELAQARVGLALAACDQATRDNRWELGYLVAHVQEPAAEAASRTPGRSLLRPTSPLLEPRWTAAAQAYVRDSAAVASAFGKGGKGKKGKGDKEKEDA